MPNQRMNSGSSPKCGRVRSICMGASTTSSPSRDSPATTARPTPTTAPRTKPTSTRVTDTWMASSSRPSVHSPTRESRTFRGESSFSRGRTPVLDASCQTASSARGLIARRQARRGCPGRRGRRVRARGAVSDMAATLARPFEPLAGCSRRGQTVGPLRPVLSRGHHGTSSPWRSRKRRPARPRWASIVSTSGGMLSDTSSVAPEPPMWVRTQPGASRRMLREPPACRTA